MRNRSDATESTVQSVDRAVTILELLAANGTLGVTRLAGELGVHKSTASRLVTALERRGLVEQVIERGQYRLGAGIVRLAGATDARLDLVDASRAACRSLADLTGETVNVAVLSGGSALYVEQEAGGGRHSGYNWVGQRIPLHATSNGKVLISELSVTERDDLLEELVEYTPATVTDRAALERELAGVVELGYAAAIDELDVGLAALAAPIRDSRDVVIGSLSVSGPTFRFDEARRAEALQPLMRAAVEVSLRMGWRDTSESRSPESSSAR